jgi:hemerythrin-like metal-binding protein
MTTATAENTLSWSDALALGDDRTDHTHQEFVDLVNATTAAEPADKLAVYQKLLEHTVEHFAQEERWMLACGIPEDFCHFTQHKGVLDVMKEVERRAVGGDLAYIDSMIEALVEWFPGHANSMDSGLVGYLKDKGYDTTREVFIDGAPRTEAPAPACSNHEPGESCA